MNIYHQLNKIVEYIEDHLEEEINDKKLSQMLCTSPYVMQRIFYFMTGYTVTEYIKRRRLSKAAADIIHGEKIIQVAFKYQYNSSEAFSRAFKSMHKINPSILKKREIKLAITPILHFEEKSRKAQEIGYRIVKNKGFQLYTHSMEAKERNLHLYTEAFWKNLKKTYPIFLNSDKRFGVVEYQNKSAIYHAGLEKNEIEGSALTIPPYNWIVVEIDSSRANNINKAINNMYDNHSKSLGYKIKPTFDIEIYYKNHVELWFPFQ